MWKKMWKDIQSLEHCLIGVPIDVPSNATAASAGPEVRRIAGCSIGQCAQEREGGYLVISGQGCGLQQTRETSHTTRPNLTRASALQP